MYDPVGLVQSDPFGVNTAVKDALMKPRPAGATGQYAPTPLIQQYANGYSAPQMQAPQPGIFGLGSIQGQQPMQQPRSFGYNQQGGY